MKFSTVFVRRSWKDHRVAEIPLEALTGLHLTRVSGGARSKSPRPMLHGFIPCNTNGACDIPHSGLHGTCPHSIKVVVVQCDNSKALYAELRKLVG